MVLTRRPSAQSGVRGVYAFAVFLGRLTVLEGTSISLVWPAAGVAALWLAAQRGTGTWPLDHAWWVR